MTAEDRGGLPSKEEYVEFVGPNAAVYLPKFMKYEATGKKYNVGWNWSTLLAGMWWFLYRKMYLMAALTFVSYMIPVVNWVAWLIWPMFANSLYHRHVIDKIQELRELNMDNYSTLLASAGGVNKWVVWVAIGLTAFIFLVAILGGFIVGQGLNGM